MKFLGRLLNLPKNCIRTREAYVCGAPAGILYWILASTIQGHSRAVTNHKVKYDLVKSFKEQNFLMARSLRNDYSVQKVYTWRQEI